MKLQNATAVPTAMYGSETWTVKRNYETGMQTAEMKFLEYQPTMHSGVQHRNKDIRKKKYSF
jgi:hypothetical protein